jgi:hypothetical protein
MLLIGQEKTKINSFLLLELVYALCDICEVVAHEYHNPKTIWPSGGGKCSTWINIYLLMKVYCTGVKECRKAGEDNAAQGGPEGP